MKKLINCLIIITLGLLMIGCQKYDNTTYQDGLYMRDVIENVIVDFSVTPSKIVIGNNNTNYTVTGTTEELMNFLESFNDEINYIKTEPNEPSFILAKKYHYYSGSNCNTWIFSKRMVEFGLEYLSSL